MATYEITQNVGVTFNVNNSTDEKYITASIGLKVTTVHRVTTHCQLTGSYKPEYWALMNRA
jgi:outer membrane receptor protein involved in Fe transport